MGWTSTNNAQSCRQMTIRHLLVILLLPLVLLPTGGCRRGKKTKEPEKDYNHQLMPGEQSLIEVDSSQLPALALTAADRTALRAGIAYSQAFLAKPSADAYYPVSGITKDQAVRSLQALRSLLESTSDDVALNAAIKARFRAFMSVGCDGQGTVLFTGYYTPIFDGSLTPDARFRFPIHKRPADLVKAGNDTMALQRMPDGSTRAYPARGELARSGALKGLELVYFADEFEAYIVQVQGSGKIRLTTGEMIDVGYDGTNGHEYHKIADDLIADGKIKKEELSLATMRAYFRGHPEEVRTYVERNPRLIFFTRTKGGPYGSLGQPVTTNVTVATDKKIFPPAAPLIVTTRSSTAVGADAPYAALRLDQDTGGAIRAPGRCDLYMGEGATAELRAGQQLSEGKLYYLILKDEAEPPR